MTGAMNGIHARLSLARPDFTLEKAWNGEELATVAMYSAGV